MAGQISVRRFLRRLLVVGCGVAVCIFLLPHGAAAQAQSKRLMLKDGSYQLATKWEIRDDRVRFFSVERNEWEEIPNSLVDWDATKQYEADRAAGKMSKEASELEKEMQEERQEEELRSPHVAAGLRLPPEGGVYALDTYLALPELVPLDQSTGEVNRHTGHNVLRAAINPLGGTKHTIEVAGPRSKTGEARCGGGLAGHPEQARLTEPGRGFDEHDLAPALSRLGQRAAELRKLTLALQKRRRRLDCHSSSPPLGTAESSYPVSLSPSREATALVTAPAEGWAAGPPGLVAAVASARSQTAWAMRCSGSRAKPSTRTAPAASRSANVRTLYGSSMASGMAAAWASAMTSFRPLVLTYGSSCVVRSWLVGAAPARRWGHPGIARRRSPGPLLGS